VASSSGFHMAAHKRTGTIFIVFSVALCFAGDVLGLS